MAFTIGRLVADSPESFTEQVGDPTGNVGGAVVPGQRQPLAHQAAIPTFATPVSTDTLSNRLRLRRQLRALLNNTSYKLTGLYIAWDDDTEQNGWYIPGQGQITAGADAALAHGYFKFDGIAWGLVGHPRTHRRAVGVYARDRRLSTTWRDTLRHLYSTDFAGLASLTVTWLPSNATDVANAVTGTPIATSGFTGTGADGSVPLNVVAQADLTVVSFEQAEANRNRGDVIIYDRRGLGLGSNPSTGPDPAWEEVYGPDYPLTASDTPVLDNGRCRVRQWQNGVTANLWAVDVWNGTAWVEQGTFKLARNGDTGVAIDTVVSSSVLEYTPERAVVKVVMEASADAALSRETCLFTLQRGWSGPRVELYLSPKANGSAADAEIDYHVALADTNDSFLKIDASAVAAIAATAGSGSALLTAATLGAASFTGENQVAGARTGAGQYAPNLAVLQAAGAIAKVTNASSAYLASRNVIQVLSQSGQGYASVHLGFYLQDANQIMEAESMTLGTGTTSVADAAASGGQTTQSTRTADAIHVSKNPWSAQALNRFAKYRIFARVKTSASTLNIYAKTNASTGVTKTTTSTSYVWIDLGDIIAGTVSLEINAWATAAATISVDRVEAFKLEATGADGRESDGARDLGRSVLVDARQTPTVATR